MSKPSNGSAIWISACGRSDRGRVRTTNQDRLLLADLSRTAPRFSEAAGESDAIAVGPVEFELGKAGVILMVADGMGGRAGGERASAAAVSAVAQAMSTGATSCTPDEMVRRLDEAVKAANRVVHSESTRDGQHRSMGTTATLAGLLGRHVYVAQVGDSRAYLARDGAIGRLTRDQSLVQDMIDVGILTEEEAERAPNNQILQAVGVAPSVNPAHTYHELRRGDVLLLCSDGLSRVVSDTDIQRAAATTHDCSKLCDQLVALANARGGPDNITVLVARLEGDGLPEAGEGDAVERRPYALGPL